MVPAKKRSRLERAARIRTTRSAASHAGIVRSDPRAQLKGRAVRAAFVYVTGLSSCQFSRARAETGRAVPRHALRVNVDRRHVLDLIHAGRNAGGHPPGHLVGLALDSRRPSFHEAGFPIEPPDAMRFPRPLIGEFFRHARYSCATSRRYAASFGSPCLAVACPNTFSPHALPKSHHLHADSSAA